MSFPSFKSKRYNLKLPNSLRGIFKEPYDSYLCYLLRLCDDICAFPAQLNTRPSLLPANANASANRWTLWVGKDIRDHFDERKAILAPEKTHGGFVEVMLLYKVHLAEKGMLPSFDGKKLSNSNQKRNSTSQNTLKHGDQRFQKEHQRYQNNYNYPYLFNFGSDMTLNDPLVEDASPYSYPVPINQIQAFDSEMSLYSASTLTKQFLDNMEDNSMDLKNQNFTFDDSSAKVLNSAETMQNFDDVLNNLAASFIENNLFQLNATSESYENEKLSYHDGGMQIPAQTEGFPDLGPFYQPVSFNIGDRVHEFGYIPNL